MQEWAVHLTNFLKVKMLWIITLKFYKNADCNAKFQVLQYYVILRLFDFPIMNMHKCIISRFSKTNEGMNEVFMRKVHIDEQATTTLTESIVKQQNKPIKYEQGNILNSHLERWKDK